MSRIAAATDSRAQDEETAPDARAGADDAAPRLLLRATSVFLRDFVAYAGWKAVRGIILAALAALFENVGIVLLIPLLTVTLDSRAAGTRIQHVVAAVFDFFHAESRVSRLLVLLVIFALLLVLRAVVVSSRIMLLGELRIGFIESHRRRILRRLAAAGWESVLRLRHARIMHVMSGDIDRVGTLAQFVIDTTVAMLMFATQCTVAFLLAPTFAALSLVLLAGASLSTGFMLYRGYHLGNLITRGYLALTHAVGQLLGGLKLAISQNLQASFIAEFEATIATVKRQQLEFLRQQSRAQAVFSTVFGLSGAVCAFLGFGVLDMPAALTITLLLVLARMNGPALQILRSTQQFAHALAAYERLVEIEAELAQGPADARAAAAPAPVDLDRPIVFRDVTFVHGGRRSFEAADADGVRNLDLTIESGEIIGVTGASGAGKTTFSDLLVGLIAPQSGTIRVGGAPLEGEGLSSWRNSISYVSQDPFLFHDTIRRNLLWADERASEADLWKALSLAGAERLVRDMAEGLDTIVGERGTLVSGGERQRIALARAILRRPRLLVLDEATSAIDVAGEHTILAALRRLDPRPTMIITAHRRESLDLCDRILTFDNGRLVGRHAPVAAQLP